jgi:DNA-directed RNA polymerase sigma subunit (sigma70/sigma32)
MKGRKVVRISVYANPELVDAFNVWRARHMPLVPQTKAIEQIIRDRIEQDEAPLVSEDRKRRAEMQAMRAAGKTLKEIGERFYLSAARVSQILRGE